MQTELTQLPQGWRRVISPDRRIYYQNDITQETSWNRPTQVQPTQGQSSTIQQPPSNVPTQPTQDSNEITQETLTIPREALEIVSQLTQQITNILNAWIKERVIIIIISLVISLNNIVSKMLLVATLSHLSKSSFCSQFQCSTDDFIAQELKGDVGFLAFFFVIGFIADLVLICIKGVHLYKVYQYPEDVFQHCVDDILNDARELKYGWVPLIQDITVITATQRIHVADGVTTNIIGIFGVYLYAIVSSLISLTRIVVLTSRVHYEFRKVHVFSNIRMCHYCWSISCVLILFPMAISIIAIHNPSPWVTISNEDYNCSMYNDVDSTGGVFGNIIKTPDLVYTDCDGSDYDYLLNCYSDSDEDIYKLNCYLGWDYYGALGNSSNETRCDNSDDDYCLFYVDLDICGNYTVNDCVNSFSFVDGDPQMWVCFDYCQI